MNNREPVYAISVVDGRITEFKTVPKKKNVKCQVFLIIAGIIVLACITYILVNNLVSDTPKYTEPKYNYGVIYDKEPKDDHKVLDCGLTYYAPSITAEYKNKGIPLIINGDTAVANSFPWIVSLRLYRYDQLSDHFCAGTIINDRWVITAGHCVDDYKYDSEKLRVVTGLHDRERINYYSQVYKVTDVITSFSEGSDGILKDIALIKLDRNIKFGKTVAYACLPEYTLGNVFINKRLVTIGWGRDVDSFEDSASQYLQQIRRLVVDDPPICSNVSRYDKESIYCTLSTKTSPYQSTCNGDSGGPLLSYNPEDKKWYLEGITSFGVSRSMGQNSKCLIQYPNFFTKIRYYRKYIDEMIA